MPALHYCESEFGSVNTYLVEAESLPGDVLVTPAERGLNSILLILGQLFVAKAGLLSNNGAEWCRMVPNLRQLSSKVCADVTWLTSLHNIEETKRPSGTKQATPRQGDYQLLAPTASCTYL